MFCSEVYNHLPESFGNDEVFSKDDAATHSFSQVSNIVLS